MGKNMAVLGLKYQCARFGGEIKTLELANQRIEREVTALLDRKSINILEIARIQSHVTDVERAAKLAFDVDLTDTDARQTWPKDAYSGWGAFTRQVLTQLRLANGLPLTSYDIANDLNQLFDLHFEEPEIFGLRTKVRDTIKSLNRKGLVKKISAPTKSNRYSTWVIADLVE